MADLPTCEGCGSAAHSHSSGSLALYIACLVRHLKEARDVATGDAEIGRAVRESREAAYALPTTTGGIVAERRGKPR
jgi:hypothetical protein